MGTFKIDIEIANHQARIWTWKLFRGVVVDTGADATWLPETELKKMGVKPFRKEKFKMANGQLLTREIGGIFIRSGRFFALDEVVFGKPGDLMILGAHTLEGWCASVDPRNKRLVSSGPALVAAA